MGVRPLVDLEVPDERLGGVDVLAEVPDPDQVELGRHPAPGRAGQRQPGLDALEQLGVLALDRAVDRDRVVDPAALARLHVLVVGRVVPGEDLVGHRLLVEVLGDLQRLARLRRVERARLAVLLDLGRAVRPEQAAPGHLGVGVLGQRGADRVAGRLGLLPVGDQLLPGVGRLLEAGLLEDVRAVVARERDQEVGHAVPLALDPADLLGEGDPAAELLADRLGDVADVGQRLAVDVGVEDREPVEDVVALLGRDLGRGAGRVVGLVDVVDRDLDVVGLPPLDDVLLVEPLVVGRDEVAPLDDLQLACRAWPRRAPRPAWPPRRPLAWPRRPRPGSPRRGRRAGRSPRRRRRGRGGGRRALAAPPAGAVGAAAAAGLVAAGALVAAGGRPASARRRPAWPAPRSGWPPRRRRPGSARGHRREPGLKEAPSPVLRVTRFSYPSARGALLTAPPVIPATKWSRKKL